LTLTLTDRYTELSEIILNAENYDEEQYEEAAIASIQLSSDILAQNRLLKAQLASSEKLLQETEISECLKDLEIFNFTTQLERKTT
jgi:hypothetical protein